MSVMPKAKDKKKKKNKPMIADSADRYVYYQKAVQVPEEDVAFMQRVFKDEFGSRPKTLREDFCGTALCACSWVEAGKDNRVWGVDLDPEPIEWGKKHNLSQLNDEQRSRVTLIEGNAMDGGTPPVDVVTALNFSYYCFRERQELLRYFRAAHSNLGDRGLFVIDMEGGWEALDDGREEREEEGFTYVWEQEEFNAIDHHVRCKIHFEFEDGSVMEDAFTYDWRIWTLPEIRDLLIEA
ncbi:MAG: class I SAM-dependent methyltransferase, partial [Planctomycetes bacterium]|nr:class I SAM-dependent methyltransferase [Planctomycetota bacterium]